jgi:hypothetical protein
MQFQQVVMPDGTAKGRKMWRAVAGEAYAAFYPVGRKGEFYVTWGYPGRDGGQRVMSRADAENKATQILLDHAA